MKKPTKSIITSSLLAVAFGALSVGSTFALFTSQAETEIDVASGKVSVSQQLSIEEMTSALAGSSADYSAYTRQDGWVNGGTAEVGTNGTLTVSKMTPGDELVFKAQMKNESNVNIKYRYVFRVTDSTSLLASGLDITLAGVKYSGLLNYKSDWMTLEPSADPAFADLIEGKIYMPLERDNVFQDLSATYLLSIEAVQGNAYTEAGASFECAAYLPKAQVLDVNEKATVAYEETATAPAVNVELDFSNNDNYEAGQEVVLNVNTVDVVENQSSFVVSEDSSAAAAIDLNLYIDGTKVTEDFVAKISTKVAAGLTSVKVQYDTEDTSKAFYNGGTRVETLAELNEPGKFYYNATSGELVFITDHFSDYIVTADNIVAYNKTRKVSYVSLQDAINQANAGDTVCLLNDITITTAQQIDTSKTYGVKIDKSITLDGKGHKITGAGEASRVIGVVGASQDNMVDVVIRNLTSKAYNGANAICLMTRNYVNSVTLDNVVLDDTATISQNAQNFTIGGYGTAVRHIYMKDSVVKNQPNIYYPIITFVPVEMTLDNCQLSGYCSFYFKSGSRNSEVVMNGGSIISNGNVGYSNSFAAVVFEDSDCEVEFNDVDITIELSPYKDSVQALVMFSGWYGPNTGDTLTVKGGKITLRGEATALVLESGVDNSLTIIDAIIDHDGTITTSFSYNSKEHDNSIAYLYKYSGNTICKGVFEFNELLAANSAYENHLFCAGEWFEFYDSQVALTADAVFDMRAGKVGEFGFILGTSTLVTNDHHITLPADVIINSDVQLASVFAALEGYHIVESKISGTTYHYSYTAVANA